MLCTSSGTSQGTPADHVCWRLPASALPRETGHVAQMPGLPERGLIMNLPGDSSGSHRAGPPAAIQTPAGPGSRR
jgi:hypothetical protein